MKRYYLAHPDILSYSFKLQVSYFHFRSKPFKFPVRLKCTALIILFLLVLLGVVKEAIQRQATRKNSEKRQQNNCQFFCRVQAVYFFVLRIFRMSFVRNKQKLSFPIPTVATSFSEKQSVGVSQKINFEYWKCSEIDLQRNSFIFQYNYRIQTLLSSTKPTFKDAMIFVTVFRGVYLIGGRLLLLWLSSQLTLNRILSGVKMGSKITERSGAHLIPILLYILNVWDDYFYGDGDLVNIEGQLKGVTHSTRVTFIRLKIDSSFTYFFFNPENILYSSFSSS